MTNAATLTDLRQTFQKRYYSLVTLIGMFMLFGIPVCATSDAGTTASAITDVGTALTGVLGYFEGVTSELLGNDMWILGMAFFVVSFIAGFVMYLFRVGRR